MTRCSICSHEHIRFIDYYLEEEQPLPMIARFFEIDPADLEAHRAHMEGA